VAGGGWIAVGRVRRPHGVHGEVVADVETDFPERMVGGVSVGLGGAGPEEFLTVASVRMHKGAWLLAFAGIDDRDAVEGFRDRWLFLPEQERSALPERFYYEHELVGSECFAGDGRALGRVVELLPGGGGSLLVIAAEGGGEALVPFVSPIVVRVEPDARRIFLDPPAGLFDEDAL
jgi:16S rRNA processing protein RimM